MLSPFLPNFWSPLFQFSSVFQGPQPWWSKLLLYRTFFLVCTEMRWLKCLPCRREQWAWRQGCQQNHHLPPRGSEVWLWTTGCAGQLRFPPFRYFYLYLFCHIIWKTKYSHVIQQSWLCYFTVVLMENGDVYTFGYGQHGQLGHGDVNSRYGSLLPHLFWCLPLW